MAFKLTKEALEKLDKAMDLKSVNKESFTYAIAKQCECGGNCAGSCTGTCTNGCSGFFTVG